MHLDVQDLRNFYYRSALGRAAQRALREAMLGLWPDARHQSVIGFGFAAPLLRPYLAQARRVITLMPAPQGVMPWPAGAPNVSVLCDEAAWPLDTGMADKIVVLHGLETSDNATALLEELRRALGPGGRALFIVPNRAGLWSRSDATPFGYGRPYTSGQLESQLRGHGLQIERQVAALHQLPSARRFWLRAAPIFERAGRVLPAGLAGGVLMTEVSKQVHQPSRPGLGAAVRQPLEALDGLAQPAGAPSRLGGQG